MPKGSLSLNCTGTALPPTAPSYPYKEDFTFSNITLASVSYRVTAESVAHVVPDIFELEDEPLVTTVFIEYGMSTVGQYTETGTLVEVTYKGEKFDFSTQLILDNEAAIFAGREVFGYPKVFGNVQFANKPGAIISAYAERPAGRKVVEFDFTPERQLSELPKSDKRQINLRLIPSPVVGAVHTVKDLVPAIMAFKSSEVWTGTGSIHFPRKSAIDKWADVDILKYEGAFLARNATATLYGFEPLEL
ncbi:Hypothetical protein NCS54_01458700 [Fusarium falciforme]|uniref:Hypothetical protein n=1 Tax=Fusarium falciforme TaxID=195108 RepID=UPI002301ABB0|nr:Hypothetical protein NCS54_01458700 [Fusarium falciforme]WAO96895.1 Hypothetical protein NCS54_01458700 [Fusarium falciforme]